MALSVLAICGIFFLRESSALNASYFNLEEFDHSDNLRQGLTDILSPSPNAADVRVVRFISDNLDDFDIPVKFLRTEERTFIIGSYQTIYSDATFIEIKCRGADVGKILENISPRLVNSYSNAVILDYPESFHLHEIETCMMEVFESFWEKRMTNVAVLFVSNNEKYLRNYSANATNVFAYVYEPYDEKPLKNVTGMNFHALFYDKVANMHLHPLKVLAHESNRFFYDFEDGKFQLVGIDGALTKLLGQTFNATIIINYWTKKELRRSNVSLESIITSLNNGSNDVWINVRSISPKAIDEITYTNPIERRDVICILPKDRDEYVKYKNFGGTNVISILLLTASLFSITSIFVFLSGKILRKNVPILKLAKLVLNQSDAITRRTSSPTLQILMATWLFCSFVCSTSLQTSITAKTIGSNKNNRMSTIAEVLESDIRLRIRIAYWDMIKTDFDKKTYRAIRSHLEFVNNDNLYNVQGPDVGYITAKDILHILSSGRYKVYVVHETFLPNLVAYYSSQKSPFVRRLSQALLAFMESGISQKWMIDNEDRFFKNSKLKEKVSRTKYITLKHLKTLINIFAGFMLISIVLFICELKYHKYKNN